MIRMPLFSMPLYIKKTFLLLLVLNLISCASLNPPPPSPYSTPTLSERDLKHISIVGELPKPPTEYEWTIYKGLAFLKPTFWREYKNSKIYISSPLPLTEDAEYDMGISARTIENIQKQNNIEAQAAAMKLINIIHKKKTTKKLIFTKDFSKTIKVINYRYLDTSNPKATFIKHLYFFINNEESYIHIFDYKSPAKSWDSNWKNRALLIFNNLHPIDIF